MNADDPRHGTSAGYQAHRKAGQIACEPCRQAHSAKIREFRKNPVQRKKTREVSRAATRALWRLAAAHRDEYERYYAEELAALRVVEVTA